MRFLTKRHMKVIAYRDQIYVQCTTCVVNDCIQFAMRIIAKVKNKNQRSIFTKIYSALTYVICTAISNFVGRQIPFVAHSRSDRYNERSGSE